MMLGGVAYYSSRTTLAGDVLRCSGLL
ncbi:unnamed protein product [Chondrus crispus]|uniref:Uncharacterized protein n=1 Tax=Chondrus crispus TaxID=2769 RepID=R7QFB0_CHOCR|nr:unnamed protein product [Chondrus crispus]CDF37212.1 unnamed protein product [Chondrus crispus]|eukprot:XP_005717031.1 unnamed protein product [Chondrus crispus]